MVTYIEQRRYWMHDTATQRTTDRQQTSRQQTANRCSKDAFDGRCVDWQTGRHIYEWIETNFNQWTDRRKYPCKDRQTYLLTNRPTALSWLLMNNKPHLPHEMKYNSHTKLLHTKILFWYCFDTRERWIIHELDEDSPYFQHSGCFNKPYKPQVKGY